MMPRHLSWSLLTALVGLAVLAGCTNNSEPELPSAGSDDDPTPTTADNQAATPSDPPSTDTPIAAPTAEQAAQALVDYRDVLYQLPPAPQDEVVELGVPRLEETTTATGTARSRMEAVFDELAAEGATAVRGQTDAVVVSGPNEVGPETWEATACVSESFQPRPFDGEPADDALLSSTGYVEVPISIAPNDEGNDWLLDDYDAPTGDDPRIDCIPPDLEQTISDRWDTYIELDLAAAAAAEPQEVRAALEPLRDYMTPELIALQEESIDADDRGILEQSRDVFYGMEITSASATRAVTEWCDDPSLDPDAVLTVAGSGEQVDISDTPPSVYRAEWILGDDVWRVSQIDRTVQGTENAPEEHRCF